MVSDRHLERALPDADVDVSVVIAAYRGAETIADCLESVQRATESRQREIIVVESSGDGTSAIVQQRFPDVVLISSAERLSAGGARNRGFLAARGRLVFVTDQDCIVPPDWVDRLERHFADPAVGGVGGSVGARDCSNLSGFALYVLEFLTHFPRRGAPRRNRNFLIGCNSAYRAAALRAVSFPDQTLGEDVLFSNELREQGFDLLYDPTIEVQHQNRAGWAEFFSYNRVMGRSAARYRQKLKRWWMTLFLRVPALAFVAPVVILPTIAFRLARGRWSYLLQFLLLSPMCLLGNLQWAKGFSQQLLEDRSAEEATSSGESVRGAYRPEWMPSGPVARHRSPATPRADD